MIMARKLKFINFVAIVFVLLTIQASFTSAYIDNEASYPRAILDLKDAIVKGMGFQADDFKVSGFDLRDVLVGKSVAYEFDVEIDNKVLPLKLLEDVNRWEYVDLPIFQMENQGMPGDVKGMVERRKPEDENPVLAPFQLAGPMELWIQDAKDMRISLPHDVDAGVLKKVILAEGAVVTVRGARSVSLRHPIQFPLPLNRTNNGFASGLMALAEHLRHVSGAQDSPLLSLRIVGPTSLTSPSTSSASSSNKLKLKRLAPGLVELSSVPKIKSMKTNSQIDIQGEATALLTPDHFTALWPLTSINGSNANLLGFEALLSSLLGHSGTKEGSFKLLKADVSAQTFVKIGFGLEKKLKEGDESILRGFPDWRTKPETIRMHFEVLAKVDGTKIVPERVVQVNPLAIEDTATTNVLRGNVTTSNTEVIHPPPIPFTL